MCVVKIDAKTGGKIDESIAARIGGVKSRVGIATAEEGTSSLSGQVPSHSDG
jgi:hypothetical protein